MPLTEEGGFLLVCVQKLETADDVVMPLRDKTTSKSSFVSNKTASVLNTFLANVH